MSATYDDNNIFAKILRGEIPSTRVYETDDVVAFMDVMPQEPATRWLFQKPLHATCLTQSRKRSPKPSKPCRRSQMP